MQRSIVLASAMFAGAVSAAAASPIFTFLSSERYVEAWAIGWAMEPPQYDYQRMDAPGFESFALDLTVSVEDDLGQRVSARVTQNSWLHSQGMTVSGQATGNSGPPVGSSEAYSHSRFFLQFQVSRDIVVPLYLHVTDREEPNAEFHFTGPGVDLHFLPYDQPLIHFEGMMALVANQTYTMAFDVRGDSWPNSYALYELQFWVPAPATSALFLIAPALVPRRRR